MNQLITAVVLTSNEADNIRRCLSSLIWCDEIILLADITDNTVSLAKRTIRGKKLRVFNVKIRDNFAKLRNFALKKVKTRWVLFIDADEEVTAGLAIEISRAINNEYLKGFYIPRRDYFLGRWLRFGETGNIKLLKLGRKDSGLWRRSVHEVWDIAGKVGELDSPLFHYPHPTIGEFIERVNRWTTLDAAEFYKSGVRSGWWKMIVYPAGKFVRNYIVKLGFLDGIPGLLFALIMSFHSFLTRAKLYMLHEK